MLQEISLKIKERKTIAQEKSLGLSPARC